MLDVLKKTLANQFDAVFCTLNSCIDLCPASAWEKPVVNLRFCQVVFHTLFFADYYLGENEAAFRQQPFHLANQAVFLDYEELADRPPVNTYEKLTTLSYLKHCREKATAMIAQESIESFSAACGFARRDFSRAELYVVNIRHIHHHAAQLSLRLRIDHQIDVPWFGSGWRTD